MKNRDKTIFIPFGKSDCTVFRKVMSTEDTIKEFAPDLRTSSQSEAFHIALQMLGDLCGFGLGYFDFDETRGYVRTATEVSSENSALMRNIRRHENALEGAITSQADEEMVADIFVRVNSKGQALGQDDFIMTLLSVYEPEMRERIEAFCADSHVAAQGTSYNPLITVSPTHIIRTTVGLGFKRGRLRYAYQIMRGRDLKTKETSAKTRFENFETFGSALDKVLDLNNWHAYINILAQAGYISSTQVTSANALFFCYAFYLIGKYEFKMETLQLQKLTRRWFYASALTAFYVGSFESDFERQLNDVSALNTADECVSYFEREIGAMFTDDYFRVTLPLNYDANEATGPSWQGFVAAQIVLGVKVLFSTAPLAQLLTMGSSGKKNALDKHHLFPDHYLKEQGYFSNRSNRANFTYLDYQNNIYIQDDAPEDYVPRYRDALGEDEFKRCCREHALPEGFESMDYEEFLAQRRVLMAQLVKDGFEKL